jgi:hypothetical protein
MEPLRRGRVELPILQAEEAGLTRRPCERIRDKKKREAKERKK